jgi:excinuclease ABC subunit B
VRGDVVECWPAYEEIAFRIELWGDDVETLSIVEPTTGDILRRVNEMAIYPAKHFVLPEERIEGALSAIQQELEERLQVLRQAGKLLEAQRLGARTRFDMEMLRETGYCPGIENYSRHLSGRAPGQPPFTLYDFFPDDYLMFVDESHVTIPQVRGMFAGDRSRKTTLIEHGFRLPSALDNRPLEFPEWETRIKQGVFVSATPGPFELEQCGGEVVEQIIRPTGLVDPVVHVVSARGQVPHLIGEIRARAERQERVLVTTLTKRLAEDLTHYLQKEKIRCQWLHSELDAFERVQVLRELREGLFDVVVGVNLLREGLDLPEVSLVAILDSDKEGFLRSETSLVQTIGRTARNVNAEVILYADQVTPSMQRAIDETRRRRETQLEYNKKQGITPETSRKAIRIGIEEEIRAGEIVRHSIRQSKNDSVTREFLNELETEMHEAAKVLDFERAAELRDRIQALKGEGDRPPGAPAQSPSPSRRGNRSRRRTFR